VVNELASEKEENMFKSVSCTTDNQKKIQVYPADYKRYSRTLSSYWYKNFSNKSHCRLAVG